jgi:hypothetical protein
MSRVAEWRDAVVDSIRSVAGETAAREALGGWEQTRSAGPVRCVFYGPYDTGKTSLIRRLLAEDNLAVPEFLTVSGKVETSAAREVPAGDLVYVDSPGTVSGADGHDDAAHTALLRADVVVLVLGPGALRGDTVGELAVVDGRHFTGRVSVPAAGLFPPGSLVFVLGRSDNAPVDPEDDPEGFELLRAERRRQLLDLLGERVGARDDWSVHVVAADPRGRVRGRLPVTAASYADADRAWDGIARLRDTLRATPARRAALREAAGVRYLGHAATDAVAAGRARQAGLADRRAALVAERGDLATLAYDLRAADGTARAELRRRVNDSLVRTADLAGGAEPAAVAENRISQELADWHQSSRANLARLAARVDGQVGMPTVAPVAAAAAGGLTELVALRDAELRDWKAITTAIGRAVTFAGDNAEQLSAGWFRLWTGLPLDEARREAQRFASLSEAEQESYGAVVGGQLLTRARGFDDVERHLATQRRIRGAIGFTAKVVPAATEDLRRRMADRQRQERARRLRDLVDRLTSDQVAETLGPPPRGAGWAGAVEALLARVEARGTAVDEELAALDREDRQLTADAATLTRLTGEAAALLSGTGPAPAR